jgi:hypothetical protein
MSRQCLFINLRVHLLLDFPLKLLTILGGVVGLCTAPVFVSNTSHAVQLNSNTTRVNRNDVTIKTKTLQEMESSDFNTENQLSEPIV